MIGPPMLAPHSCCLQLVLRDAARLVDDAVRVQLFALNLIEDLAAEVVRAALGHELDLHRAFGAGLGRQARGRDRDLFDRAEPDRARRRRSSCRRCGTAASCC